MMHPIRVIDNVFVKQLTGDVHLPNHITNRGLAGRQVNTLHRNNFTGVDRNGPINLRKGASAYGSLNSMPNLIMVIHKR